ncbi:hypothetical protein EPI10_019843 [Gossypium australe]|uniref:Uncharacterized protein n=1 Tax=Gossypium australe TaxID=47621 RepID=A0A5B6WDU2_9ROSI|nr:hypothetical protein EPI10_019843 [Gossypium australe]
MTMLLDGYGLIGRLTSATLAPPPTISKNNLNTKILLTSNGFAKRCLPMLKGQLLPLLLLPTIRRKHDLFYIHFMPTRVTEEFIVFVIDSHASPKDQGAWFNICMRSKRSTNELAVVGSPIYSKEFTGKGNLFKRNGDLILKAYTNIDCDELVVDKINFKVLYLSQ